MSPLPAYDTTPASVDASPAPPEPAPAPLDEPRESAYERAVYEYPVYDPPAVAFDATASRSAFDTRVAGDEVERPTSARSDEVLEFSSFESVAIGGSRPAAAAAPATPIEPAADPIPEPAAEAVPTIPSEPVIDQHAEPVAEALAEAPIEPPADSDLGPAAAPAEHPPQPAVEATEEEPALGEASPRRTSWWSPRRRGRSEPDPPRWD
jgi:hypothetical protein